MHRFPQIATPLHVQPELGTVAEYAGKNERSRRGHLPAVIAQLVNMLALNAHRFGQCGLGQPHRRHELLDKDFRHGRRLALCHQHGSAQHYLTAIKALLIGAKKIAPVRELVFPPSGGTKTARVVASILTDRDDKLPIMLLDGDEPGKRMARELRSGLYTDAKNKILCIDDFTGLEKSEIEDLIPADFFAQVVDRLERTPEKPFADVVNAGEPLVGQVEDWAKKQGVTLPEGWKVEVEKRTKQRALTRGIGAFEDVTIEKWVKLFEAFANGG